MKNKFSIYLATILLAIASASCDDDVTTVGSSLITDKSEIIIDSTFVATGHSIEPDSVQSRTITQLIGRLDADGYGALSSEIVTQFMPSLKLDTTGVSVDDIQSMEMLMFFTTGNFTGDSLVPLGIKVYPLTKQLPSPIYSNFNPQDYYDASQLWSTKIYTGNALQSDSLEKLSYRTIAVQLPLSFAKKFYTQYLNSPETFATPQAFAKFFPGLYIQNSFGDGRVTNISETRINMHYKRHATITTDSTTRDTVYNISRTYMAVTPEVITNNIIKLNMSSSLTRRIASGEALIVAPVGYDVEMQFPLPQILASYRSQAGPLAVVNTLSMSIPVLPIENNYGINPPENVLIVLSKDKTEFFANNSLTDSKTSFLATYNSTTKRYEVSGMRDYMLDMLAKDPAEITPADYTFTITPVEVETETSSSSYYYSGQTYVVSIAPYVSGPAMCQLLLDKTKIKLTFGKQSANF